MENDRKAGQAFFHLFENIEAKRRRHEDAVGVSRALGGLELVCPVRRSDRDRKAVDTGSLDEIFDLFRAGVGGLFCDDLVLDPCEHTELAFDGDVVLL